MATPLAGKNSKVRFGSNKVYAQEWDVEPESSISDTSNFEGDGFEEQVTCLSKCMVNIAGWWDGAANIHETPLSLKDGAVIENVKIYLSGTTGPHWSFPKLTVISVPVNTKVNDKINFRLRGKAQGSFVYPTGTVS